MMLDNLADSSKKNEIALSSYLSKNQEHVRDDDTITLSILIPSTSERKLIKTVEYIINLSKNIDFDIIGSNFKFEIVCCIDKRILKNNDTILNDKRVKIVPESYDNVGSIKPINMCFKESVGEYFLVTCDDVSLNINAFYLSNFIESNVFKDRKYKICSIGYYDSHKFFVPNDFCPCYRCKHIPILSFPAGERDSVNNLLNGMIFNESFKHVAADNWLSYYLNSKNEAPVFMPDTKMILDEDVRNSKSEHVRDDDETILHKLLNTYNKNNDLKYTHKM